MRTKGRKGILDIFDRQSEQTIKQLRKDEEMKRKLDEKKKRKKKPKAERKKR